MASRKRSRAADDIDGEVEIESASSSFRQQSITNKRSRVSLAQQNGGSVVSDDDDDDDADNGYADEDMQNEPSNGYSDEENEDEEIDELQATQIVQKQISKHRDNIASEEGVIEEVFCRNFMCHSKLRIKLGPLINFVIGHNGSGKSAVLTALTMCLGGKATATNRGASLKSLIKEGQESATLAVKIKNQGESAYKPETYGASITVERHFSKAGTSGFRLKNAEDKTITTLKKDLDDILDYFAFQLENPINVLTQDMARQFLANSSASDKYKFFIRGTQLETLDHDYSIIEESVDDAERKLESREDDINVLKQRMDEAERKKKRSEQTQRIQDKITKLQCQHAWAQVEKQEEERDQWIRVVQEAQQNVQDKEEAAQEAGEAYETHNQSWEAAKATHEESRTDITPLQAKRDAEKDKLATNTKELTDVKAQQRHIKDNVSGTRKTITKIEQNIAEEQGRLQGAEGAEHAERMKRLEELKEAAQEAIRAQTTHGTGVADLQRKREAAAKDHEDAKPTLTQNRENVKRAENQLQRMRSEQPRPYAGYLPNMDQLVRAINQETRWQSKPVGPMGKHVTLLQAKWSSQIEKTLGGALDGFVVTTKQDQTLLADIGRRVRCSPIVYIGDAEPLDTTGKEPQTDVDTILRVLKIDSDLVRNQLIINNGIDQTVLIEDLTQARDFLHSTPRPRNVRATICISARDPKQGTRFDTTRTGGERSSPVAAWSSNDTRMQSDRQDQIRVLEGHLRRAKEDFNVAEQQCRELQTLAENARKEITRFERRQKELKTEAQGAEDAVEAMQAEIENNRPEDGRLQELETQLADSKEDLASGERNYIDSVNSVDQFNERARAIKNVLDEAQADFSRVEAKTKEAERLVQQAEAARREALHEKNLAIGLVTSAQGQVEHVCSSRDEQQANVDRFVEMAEQVCGRINVTEGSHEQIQNTMDRLGADMRRQQAEVGGSRHELTVAFQQARDEYENAKGVKEVMEGLSKTLKRSLATRHHRWKMFRKYISARARITFMYLLSERQFRGRVLMNHSAKELDISVEPDHSKVSDSGRQTKTLSGGEKSFSTICLLLSIWEAMGSPIRCLDEFDVFMDSVNRATSMTMMIQAARRSVGRQFILITPQSMNSVEMGDDVKVHKMSDPERGQTTLPY